MRQSAISVLSELLIFECNSKFRLFEILGFGSWKKTGFGKQKIAKKRVSG